MQTLRRLSLEEELELGKRVCIEGDLAARNTLVLHTRPLVGWVARKFAWSRIESDDLMQEGTVGLVIAADRWDPSPGFGFSSFAKWWIYQMINRLVMEYGVIRIPANVANEMYKIRRAMNELAITHGRIPTEAEIATTSMVSEKRVRRALQVLNMHVLSSSQLEVSALSGKQTGEVIDWFSQIADSEALHADHLLEAREELDAACERLNGVTEALYQNETIAQKHRDMFVRFYGLEGTLQVRTFEATGEKFGATKGAVCIAIGRIWKKLQDSGIDFDHEAVLAELG